MSDTVGQQATAAATSHIGRFSNTAPISNQKVRLTHPFQILDNELNTIPEETKEVEMKEEDNTMDELILQYAKTMKEIEDQDCYEQN